MRPQTPLVLFNSGLWPVSWVVAGIQWCQLVKEAHISFVGFLRHARAHTFGMWPESQPWWRWKWQQSAALLTRRRLACGWWSWVPQQCWSDVKIPKWRSNQQKRNNWLCTNDGWMGAVMIHTTSHIYIHIHIYIYIHFWPAGALLDNPFCFRMMVSTSSFGHSGTNCLLRHSMPKLTMASEEPQGFHEVLMSPSLCKSSKTNWNLHGSLLKYSSSE